MALTAEEEEQVRQLLARESAQEQKVALASQGNFENWLRKVAKWLAIEIGKEGIKQLFVWARMYFLGF